MKTKPTIIPAILTDNQNDLEKKLAALAGWAPAVHVDVCDGQFVPSRTLTMAQYATAPTSLPRKLHLMVADPLPFLPEALRLGFGPILVHVEVIPDLKGFIERVRRDHLPVGLVVNPETSLDQVLELAPDHLMMMGVHPGFQGAEFLPQTLARVRTARTALSAATIEVDGGVSGTTIQPLAAAGASRFVVGSALWRQSTSPHVGYQTLQRLIEEFHSKSEIGRMAG